MERRIQTACARRMIGKPIDTHPRPVAAYISSVTSIATPNATQTRLTRVTVLIADMVISGFVADISSAHPHHRRRASTARESRRGCGIQAYQIITDLCTAVQLSADAPYWPARARPARVSRIVSRRTSSPPFTGADQDARRT